MSCRGPPRRPRFVKSSGCIMEGQGGVPTFSIYKVGETICCPWVQEIWSISTFDQETWNNVSQHCESEKRIKVCRNKKVLDSQPIISYLKVPQALGPKCNYKEVLDSQAMISYFNGPQAVGPKGNYKKVLDSQGITP